MELEIRLPVLCGPPLVPLPEEFQCSSPESYRFNRRMGSYHSCYWADSIQSLSRKIFLLSLLLHNFLTLKTRSKQVTWRREEQARLISAAISQVFFSAFKIQNRTKLPSVFLMKKLSNNF